MSKEKKRVLKRVCTNITTMLIAMILTIVISVITEPIYGLELPNEKEPDITTRLEKISANLLESTEELEDIQVQLEKRIEYVEDLKKEAEAAESVLELSETQLKAIHSMLGEELEKNDRENRLPNTISNIFYCILGMIIPPIVKFMINKIKAKRKNKSHMPETCSES